MQSHEALRDFLRYTVPNRLLKMLATLLVIVYLAQFLLILADRGRNGLPAQPIEALGDAFTQTVNYVVAHPQTYYWHKDNIPAFQLVADTAANSAGLLLFSLGLATLIGVPLGITIALSKRRGQRNLMLLISVLGTSIPSFLLAMLLWVVNILLHNSFNTPALPITGFGWDAHLVLPALVLMARPLAQIAQVTYVTMTDVMRQDYIRLAYAKGFARFAVVNGHALKNAAIPIMTTMGTSLRFSLASLPIVESFFIWPGVGAMLLDAIRLGNAPLVTDLIVSLGLLFLGLNLVIEFVYPLIDPRLREKHEIEERADRESWRERVRDGLDALKEWWAGATGRLLHPRQRTALPPLPVNSFRNHLNSQPAESRSRGWVLRAAIGNRSLVIGLALLIGMLVLVFYGDRLTINNPYQTHGVMMINSKIGSPPYPPSSVFPWGSDLVGRDIQALVLWGARQTLALAFFAMVARIVLGTILGAIAGWTQGGAFDRLVTSGIDVWAAFPVTIFAMLLIQAIGIQQGTWVFIVSLAVVAWGEVAQFVRSKVIAIKPQPYIESARTIGVQAGRMLSRHVFPNLVPSLIVLAALEMGSVLMLLAELGFLNIFLGGGFRAEIGEAGRAQAIFYYFSDIPEWGALLSNIRNWWRSYPWLVWYAGVAFFVSIVTFNVLAEGLRRFLDESRINVGKVFNRYTALAVTAAGLVWVLWTTAPVGQYSAQAEQFDARRALQDIQVLSSREDNGRETGTAGAQAAADYIEQRMQEIGLQPAGNDPGYRQEFPCPRYHMTETPVLEIGDTQSGVTRTLQYRRDFAEYVGLNADTFGEITGSIVGLALGPVPDQPGSDPYGLRSIDLSEKIVVVRESTLANFNPQLAGGVLAVMDDPHILDRKYLYYQDRFQRARSLVMTITPDVAERLLATAGSSLAKLDQMTTPLATGKTAITPSGTQVHMKTVAQAGEEDLCTNVIGFIPGTASQTTTGITEALDSQVIIVSAYYDGLGAGPDGSFYPGANDNASGVAAMLEMARVLKASPYAPKKTIVFAAWPGGERGEGFSVKNVMNAKTGFGLLTVEAVIELSGMGAGTGDAIELAEGSSYRLVQLYQTAGARLGNAMTTRGRDPHFGLPAAVGFGGRSGLTLNVSWDGSDATAHTIDDTAEAIDLEKLRKSGQTTMLVLMVLSRETEY